VKGRQEKQKPKKSDIAEWLPSWPKEQNRSAVKGSQEGRRQKSRILPTLHGARKSVKVFVGKEKCLAEKRNLIIIAPNATKDPDGLTGHLCLMWTFFKMRGCVTRLGVT